VSGPVGRGAAVLLRGLEPVEGLATMRARRRRPRRTPVPDRLLCRGPGNLCKALGITRELDGVAMADSPVVVLRGVTVPDHAVTITPRIGITQAAAWPLRFVARQ
jgi:DNA-3-methyladenine glycosylase